MKKALLILGSVCATLFSIGQTQQNEINTTGKIGIGTTTPTNELEVEGKTMLNGELEVTEPARMKDCVVVEKDMTIERDIKVKGTGVFTDQLKAKSNFKVLGTSTLKGNVKFTNLNANNLLEDNLLTIGANGQVRALDKGFFIKELGDQLLEPLSCSETTDGQVFGRWFEKKGPDYGTIFTTPLCSTRVGIGIVDPEYQFQMEEKANIKGGLMVGEFGEPEIGLLSAYQSVNTDRPLFSAGVYEGIFGVKTSYFHIDRQGKVKINKAVGIGVSPNPEAQLYIKPIQNAVGLCVEIPQNTEDDNYGVKVLTNKDNLKAFAINSLDDGVDLFQVLGNGHVYATEVHVRARGQFPDYVFEKDYSLMPLAELETYVTNNKHLPNMPSAGKLNGTIPVGEIERVLVEKVEELTLYTIEQQKIIDQLSKRLEKLENE